MPNKTAHRLCVLASASIALAACGDGGAQPPNGSRAPAAIYYERYVAAALAHPERPEADEARDAARRPMETLAFFEIQPGDAVLDVDADDGWRVEIISRIAGAEGRVIARRDAATTNVLASRLVGDRLGNVVVATAARDALNLSDASIDTAIWAYGPHKAFEPRADGSPGALDPTFRELFRVLKSGGVLGVVDAAAATAAAPIESAALGRIDPSVVKQAARDAGFDFEAPADHLRNPDDARNAPAATLAGQADRFIFRFRRP